MGVDDKVVGFELGYEVVIDFIMVVMVFVYVFVVDFFCYCVWFDWVVLWIEVYCVVEVGFFGVCFDFVFVVVLFGD